MSSGLSGFTKRPVNEHIEVTEYYNLQNLKMLSKIDDFSFLDDDDDEKEEELCKLDAIPITISKILKSVKKNDNLKRCLVQRNSIGRYYYPVAKDNFGVLYLKNPVRGFILPSGTSDLDVCNCHPTLLAQLIREEGLMCKELDSYVENRNQIMTSNNFDKYTFIIMINDKNFSSDNEFLNKIHKTIYGKFVPIMKTKFESFFTQCQVIDRLKKKRYSNAEGTFISKLLQEAEQDVMFYCMKYLKDNKIKSGCVIYDGIHVYDKISQSTISEMCKYIHTECGYSVNFSIKPFPKQDLIRKVINELDINVEEETTYENGLVTSLFKKFDKRIKYYNEFLYLKDDDYKWHSSDKQVSNILIRWMLELDKKVIVSKIEGVKKIFTARASREYLDPDLKRKFDTSTMNKLCFKNGYLDFITKEFIEWKDASDEIFTDLMIPYNYERSDEDTRNKIYGTIIGPIFDNNSALIREFLSYCARALGMNKDKFWLTSEGERDSGKGVLTSLFAAAFGPYVFEFSSTNLILRKNMESEIRNTWAEPFVKSRLGFCNETNETSEDGTSQNKLDGTKIKKLASGGDEIQIKLMRENTKSESIRSAIIMLQNSQLVCSPADAMQNMLTFRFPCYFSDKPRVLEFAKYKKIDNSLKSWIENDKSLRCAFVDIVLNYFENSVPEYKILRENANKMKEVEVDIDYDTKLTELFKFTRNEKDFVSSQEVSKFLERNDIKMTSSKIKQRLESFGAVYAVVRIGKKVMRGFKKLAICNQDELLSDSEWDPSI